jgi:hypothetical protein
MLLPLPPTSGTVLHLRWTWWGLPQHPGRGVVSRASSPSQRCARDLLCLRCGQLFYGSASGRGGLPLHGDDDHALESFLPPLSTLGTTLADPSQLLVYYRIWAWRAWIRGHYVLVSLFSVIISYFFLFLSEDSNFCCVGSRTIRVCKVK